MGNSLVILTKKCAYCEETFQTYDTEKLFCSPLCRRLWHSEHYQQFMAERKAKREGKEAQKAAIRLGVV